MTKKLYQTRINRDNLSEGDGRKETQKQHRKSSHSNHVKKAIHLKHGIETIEKITWRRGEFVRRGLLGDVYCCLDEQCGIC